MSVDSLARTSKLRTGRRREGARICSFWYKCLPLKDDVG